MMKKLLISIALIAGCTQTAHAMFLLNTARFVGYTAPKTVWTHRKAIAGATLFAAGSATTAELMNPGCTDRQLVNFKNSTGPYITQMGNGFSRLGLWFITLGNRWTNAGTIKKK